MFQENVLLKKIVHFKTGGHARYFIEVITIEQMQKAFIHCSKQSLSYFILGCGSNCIFDDRGFNGVVIKNKINFCKRKNNTYYVGAGYSFSRLGIKTAKENLSGLEFAAGIPGSIGGAICMNAGANGQETSTCLLSTKYILPNGKIKIFPKKEINFDYRRSSFQKMKGAIISASFELQPSSDTVKKQREMLTYRKGTQPINEITLGSIFKNLPQISAGRLIEESGLKGKVIGGAMVSNKHANFIVNNGSASSKDVLELITFIKKEVKQKTGLSLKEEIKIVGPGDDKIVKNDF